MNTEKNNLINSAMQYIAEIWVQHIRPMPFDHVFHCNGIRVRVTVEEYKTPSDTKPLRTSA